MTTLQQISIQELSSVVGAVSENACRIVGGAIGGTVGAVGGFFGGNPIAAGIMTGANAYFDSANNKPGTTILDLGMGVASVIPGPIGAVGGAYTFGKGGANAGAAACGYSPIKP